MGVTCIPNGARCTLHLDVLRAPRSQLWPHIARPPHRSTPRARTLTSSGRLAAGVAADAVAQPVCRRADILGRTTARKNGASDRSSQLAGPRRCHKPFSNFPLAHCSAFTSIAIVSNLVPCGRPSKKNQNFRPDARKKLKAQKRPPKSTKTPPKSTKTPPKDGKNTNFLFFSSISSKADST